MNKIKGRDVLALIICIVIPMAAGALSGIATSGNIESWYAHINKPSFNPPNWIFGPVWTLLYFLMGISLFLVWKSAAGKNRTEALLIFFIQLILNFAWSFLFFQFRMISFALIEILVIWFLIILMIITFLKVNKTAALIQVPYLLWVSYASILNGAILYLNP
jgi:translocator protein